MQVSLETLIRRKICPILERKGWDYLGNDPRSDFFQFCITEMMRWHYRKGRGVSYNVMSSLISHFAQQEKIDRLKVSDMQMALKSFTNSGLYSKIEELVSNAEIQVGIGGGHVVTHLLPALGTVGNNTCIITWDDRIRSAEDLKQSYETRFASVWSFYSLNRYPTFYNLYLNDESKVVQVRYKPNQFYIRDSKAFMLGMTKIVEDKNVYPAPIELCRGCDRRFECQTSKTRTKNWQKSW